MEDNVQKIIFTEILSLVDPIRGASNSEESLKRFFRNMGWNFDANSGMPLASITSVIGQVSQIIESVQEIIEEDEIKSLEQVLTLLSSVKSLFDKIESLVDAFDGANLPQEQIKEIIQDITHYLLVRYLEEKHYLLTEILRWIEVIQFKQGTETIFNASGKLIRYPYAFEVINFDNLSAFVSDPVKAINDIYFTPFDRNKIEGAKAFTDKLFPRLGRLAQALGAISVYGIKPVYGIDFGSVGNEMASGALTLKWQTPLNELNFGTTIAYSPKDRGDLGWVIVPFGELTLDQILGEYYLQIKSVLQVGGIIISDDLDISFETAGGLAKVNAELFLLKLADVATGLSYLIGEKDGTRIELGKVSIGSSFEATTSSLDFDVHLNIDDAKLVLSGGGQDGFMSKILPEDGIEIPFDFLIGYSTQKSLYFGVNAGLELALPVHIDILDILRVDEIYLKIKTQDYGLKTEASLSGGVSLGPLDVSFVEIGLESKLDWTNGEKNVGFANLSMDFKPPSGIGISIDGMGGGYLFFDREKEEYAGVLELTIAGFLSVKAIGLITTKMPDGSKGFSMLIIITAEFNPALQLGAGFSLMGVGGMLGLNRTFLVEPMKAGVRSGAINNIMFPKNLMANMPRIVSDLKTIFPVYEGKFLIGPMAKIGYGTPPLINLSLGLIIEIPGNLALIGVLRIILPDEKASLVKIQVAFAGIIDFDKKMISFDASLFESSVLEMTLEGDMAVRLQWGDNPDFILSVGGFHPSFTPPPLALPTLRRLALTILNNENAKIRVELYQAITSNTVQFGAKAEASFELSECSIKGHISFDALFQFSPFYFIIQLSASFSLKTFGTDLMSVRVKMSLEGPTPWKVKGTGKVSLLFFDIEADFKKTWGKRKNITFPDIAVLPMFEEELNKREQWTTSLSGSKNLLVSLRKFEETAEVRNLEETSDTPEPEPEPPLVLHPAGALVVSQKLLPLDVRIDKLGNQKTSDIQKVSISGASSNGLSLKIDKVDENFALAQYRNLSDAKKLSTASFVKMHAGVSISMEGSNIKNGDMVRKKVEYEVTIVDKEPRKLIEIGLLFRQIGLLFSTFLKGNSVSKSVLSQSYSEKLQPFKEKLNVLEEGYTVAYQADNKMYETATFANEMMAQTYMEEQISADPGLIKKIHTVPNYELQIS